MNERYKNNLVESIEHVSRTYISEISSTEILVFKLVFYNTTTDNLLAGCDAIQQIIEETYSYSLSVSCDGAKSPSTLSDGVRLEVLRERSSEEDRSSRPDIENQSGIEKSKFSEGSNDSEDTPGSVFRDCENTCPEMVVIPEGKFSMEAIDSEFLPVIRELPQQTVKINRFAIGRFEITRRQFLEFAEQNDFQFSDHCKAMDETGSWSEMAIRDIYALTATNGFDPNNFPITCINMFAVEDYIAWLNEKIGTKSYRLPSEAELEYVIKSGSNYLYAWGNDSSSGCEYSNGPDETLKRVLPDRKLVGYMDCEDGFAFFSPSGAKKANEFNVFDTVGNVLEWSADCYEDT